MKKQLITAALTTGLTIGLTIGLGAAVVPADAGGAVHETYPESYDATEHFAAGEGFCVPWAGSFREIRSGQYKLVASPGGQVPDEIHINGAIAGSVTLTPDDPRLPTYSGSYREKVNGVLTGIDENGNDVTRVSQYRLRSTLRGTDGSTLSLRLSGKMTMNAQGVLTVSRDTFSCA
jgi:hypothetical protein